MKQFAGDVVSGEPELLTNLTSAGRGDAERLRRHAARLDVLLSEVVDGAGGRSGLHRDDAPRSLRRLAQLVEATDTYAGAVGERLRMADAASVEVSDRRSRAAIAAWLDDARARPLDPQDPLAAARLLGLQQLLDARPEARVLAFDPVHGPDGEPVLTVLLGDPAASSGVAVLVPGTTHGAHTVTRDLDTAEAIRGAAAELGQEVAVIVDVWDAPDEILRDAPRSIYGTAHVADLEATVSRARALAPTAPVTLVGHSYGSFAVGRAVAEGIEVDRIVLVGSPGVGEHRVTGLGMDHTDVFVARAPRDEIEIAADADEWLLGGLAPAGFALGPDPADVEFGATAFGVNPADLDPDDPTWVQGHSSYFLPGSRSLENIATIVAGGTPAPPDPAILARVPFGTSADQLEWRYGSDGSRATDHSRWSGGSW